MSRDGGSVVSYEKTLPQSASLPAPSKRGPILNLSFLKLKLNASELLNQAPPSVVFICIGSTSPFSSTIPACFAAPNRVPMESNIFTSEKLITNINTVKIVSIGLSPPNIPAKSNLNKDTSQKSFNCSPRLNVKFDNLVTPNGIPTTVATMIPINIDAVTFLYANTAITTRPTKATIPPIIAFSCSGVTPSSLHAAKFNIATNVESFPTTRHPTAVKTGARCIIPSK